MKCPLCGCEFEEAKDSCSACPMHSKSCSLKCCPNCGYALPGESKVLRLMRRIWRRRDEG
ncbi:MAG: hypothetical protein GXO66_00245 [Euryarchaeota archaeon]|nr:hypothetical protein [Euryarchaeota archaeon]